jgi:hypothetical protein
MPARSESSDGQRSVLLAMVTTPTRIVPGLFAPAPASRLSVGSFGPPVAFRHRVNRSAFALTTGGGVVL